MYAFVCILARCSLGDDGLSNKCLFTAQKKIKRLCPGKPFQTIICQSIGKNQIIFPFFCECGNTITYATGRSKWEYEQFFSYYSRNGFRPRNNTSKP